MPTTLQQLNKQLIDTINNIDSNCFSYFKQNGAFGIDLVLNRINELLERAVGTEEELRSLITTISNFKHVEYDDKVASILAFTWNWLNGIERKALVKKLDTAIDNGLKRKLLADVEYFLEKMRAQSKKIEKSIADKQLIFVKGYELLSELGPQAEEHLINNLYDSIPVNIKKSTDVTDKLSKIIVIDDYAHTLHNSACGPEIKQKLDIIAAKAKESGEANREDRLLVLYSPDSASSLQQLTKMDIICKANVLENRLRYKASVHGLESMDNESLVLLYGYVSGILR